jgi:hypothetical protein
MRHDGSTPNPDHVGVEARTWEEARAEWDQAAPTDRPSATESQDQHADDGAGTEGSQAQAGAQSALCRAEYKRPGPPVPGDRIVRCHLPADHAGDHDELIDGEAGNWWPQEPAPADPAGLDAAIAAARHRVRIEGRWPFEVPDHVLKPAVRAAAPHLRAAALNEAADEIDRGPTFPLPPGVISELLRERAGREAP